ncbi:MAG: hypothetical protein J0L93_02950 [Deltaproteobacteria bacterium]|nr:hypothetical protein [Deltaproteobacteria bacterium]
MNHFLAEWTDVQLQRVLVEGLKKYISAGRVIHKISTSLIWLQLILLGMHFGLLLMILPWFSTAFSQSVAVWLSAAGFMIISIFSILLIVWNSERFWVNRLGVPDILRSVKNL